MTTVAAYDLAHDERNWFALYILVMNDRKKKRPLLLSYVALSLAALVAITPVFQLDRFRIEHVPRG